MDQLTISQEEQLEFEQRYAKAAIALEQTQPTKTIDGKKIAWSPQAGSQTSFLQCKVFEALYHGTRGPGKTDALLMSFAQYIGQGYGSAWRGIIFRQTYPQLADVQAKSEKWFKLIFGKGCRFNKSKMMWEFATGEVLLFRHMQTPADYWNYHGHEYPFIGWEELTNWPTDECFKSMFSCCRSSKLGVPLMVRATTNPYGAGHSWVKDRYRLHGKWWLTSIITDGKDAYGNPEPARVAIYGHVDENKILLEANPSYKNTIAASSSNSAMTDAWLRGSWDIVAGGMFGEVWNANFNVVKPFKIPEGWRLDRSFDWGSSAPFSVGWWAESDGSDYKDADGNWRSTVRGDLFRIAEWYGFTGKPNEGLKLLATEVAKGIVEREVAWGYRTESSSKVRAGPADTSIFDAENGNCIADDMEKRVRLKDGIEYRGVGWTRADKRPGSRKTGWEQMRKALKAAHKEDGKPREVPGLFIFNTCEQWLRTVPTIPRDEKDLDDVDTRAEDHIADETRYRVREMAIKVGTARTTGDY